MLKKSIEITKWEEGSQNLDPFFHLDLKHPELCVHLDEYENQPLALAGFHLQYGVSLIGIGIFNGNELEVKKFENPISNFLTFHVLEPNKMLVYPTEGEAQIIEIF